WMMCVCRACWGVGGETCDLPPLSGSSRKPSRKSAETFKTRAMSVMIALLGATVFPVSMSERVVFEMPTARASSTWLFLQRVRAIRMRSPRANSMGVLHKGLGGKYMRQHEISQIKLILINLS